VRATAAAFEVNEPRVYSKARAWLRTTSGLRTGTHHPNQHGRGVAPYHRTTTRVTLAATVNATTDPWSRAVYEYEDRAVRTRRPVRVASAVAPSVSRVTTTETGPGTSWVSLLPRGPSDATASGVACPLTEKRSDPISMIPVLASSLTRLDGLDGLDGLDEEDSISITTDVAWIAVQFTLHDPVPVYTTGNADATPPWGVYANIVCISSNPGTTRPLISFFSFFGGGPLFFFFFLFFLFLFFSFFGLCFLLFFLFLLFFCSFVLFGFRFFRFGEGRTTAFGKKKRKPKCAPP
jgi:hypothetical protein